MYFLIMNGNPDPSCQAWERYLASFADALAQSGAATRLSVLRDLNIKYCTGCWSCWHSTPGVCSLRDDMTRLYPEILLADVTVWASPLILGNVSALVKKTQDRIIPLLHPFFEMVDGECHHRRRYPKNIDMGLIVARGDGDGEEDLNIVRRLHERLAINGRGRLVFFAADDEDPAAAARRAQEAVNETVAA
jgi:multimeric flavodoxin WrbA